MELLHCRLCKLFKHKNDGRISFVHNTTDANFDRAYSYDHLARLTLATTGGAARGDTGASPYYETFGYDALSNLTSRYTWSWGQDEFSDGATYTNKRRSGWGYDADGRNTTIGTRNTASTLRDDNLDDGPAMGDQSLHQREPVDWLRWGRQESEGSV